MLIFRYKVDVFQGHLINGSRGVAFRFGLVLFGFEDIGIAHPIFVLEQIDGGLVDDNFVDIDFVFQQTQNIQTHFDFTGLQHWAFVNGNQAVFQNHIFQDHGKIRKSNQEFVSNVANFGFSQDILIDLSIDFFDNFGFVAFKINAQAYGAYQNQGQQPQKRKSNYLEYFFNPLVLPELLSIAFSLF